MLHQNNSQIHSPNPNQQPIPSNESPIYPPGTINPYPNPSQPSFPAYQMHRSATTIIAPTYQYPVHGLSEQLIAHQAQPATYHNLIQVLSEQSVTHQAPPATYQNLVQGLIVQPVVSANSSHLYNHNWANQAVVNQSLDGKLEQPKQVQPVQCEICNIKCDTRDVYNKHIYGKKHNKNLKRRAGPAAVLPHSSSSIGYLTSSGQVDPLGGQLMHGASSIDAGTELDIKTKNILNGGATADSVRVCTVCNVVCNSEEVFNKHLAGRKHAIQANLGLPGVGPLLAGMTSRPHKRPKKPKIIQSVWCEVCKINCNSQEIYANHLVGKRHQKSLGKLESSSGNNAEKPAAQSSWCEVCKITCNTQDNYIIHLTGKKHQRNLGKVSGASESKANTSELVDPSTETKPINGPMKISNVEETAIIGPMENLNAEKTSVIGPMGNPNSEDKSTGVHESQKRPAQNVKLPEDLETKRRKVLESGAEAGAVRTCTICSVVCNSDLVFSHHLAGQKHAAMVKKQLVATVARTGA